MKKIIIKLVAFFAAVLLSAAVDPAMESSLEKYFEGKGFALLNIDEIPAMAENGKGGDALTKEHSYVSIKNGGKWKKNVFGGMGKTLLGVSDEKVTSTAKLPENELLEIVRIKVKKKEIEILVKTVTPVEFRNLKRRKAYDIHRVLFSFIFDKKYMESFSEENLKIITEGIGKYLTFFSTLEEAEKAAKEN